MQVWLVRRSSIVFVVLSLLLAPWATIAAGEPAPPVAVGHTLTLDGVPLADAVRSAALAPALAQGQRGRSGLRKQAMLWGGVGLGVLGFYMATLGAMPHTEAFCFSTEGGPQMVDSGGEVRPARPGECDERRQLGGLFWTGIGVAALGSTLVVKGVRASVQPGGLRLDATIPF